MNSQIQGRQPQGEGNFKQGKLGGKPEQGQQGRFYALGSQNAESNTLVEEPWYRDFFHDHNHVLIHVHEFGTILHSLQGMIQI
ncbi:hypothetical protein AAG906_024684 [Vitis piasezkii]